MWAGQDQEGYLPKSGPHATSTKVISSAGDLSRVQDNLSIVSYTLTPSQQKVCPFFYSLIHFHYKSVLFISMHPYTDRLEIMKLVELKLWVHYVLYFLIYHVERKFFIYI